MVKAKKRANVTRNGSPHEAADQLREILWELEQNQLKLMQAIERLEASFRQLAEWVERQKLTP